MPVRSFSVSDAGAKMLRCVVQKMGQQRVRPVCIVSLMARPADGRQGDRHSA